MKLSSEAKVGALVVMAIALLSYITVLLGGSGFAASNYRVQAVFQAVDGLKEGNLVRYAGVHVGKVVELRITDEGVIVAMDIKDDAQIDRKAVYRIGSDGLIGEKCVDITPPAMPSGQYAADGDSFLGQSAAGMEQVMARSEEALKKVEKLLDSMNDVIGSPETKQALIDSMKNVQLMTANMEQMTRVMATLAVQNEAGLNQMLGNMMAMMEGMNKTVSQIESMMTIIANDGETAKNIRDMLANMKITTDRVANMAGALEGVVTDPETADNLKITLKNARSMSERADSMMNKIGSMKITAGAEVYGDPESGDIMGGFDVKLRTSEKNFALFGFTGIGVDTKTNAQLGYGTDAFAGRFGIMEDKLGLGLDSALGSRTKFYLDLYDPNDVKVKLRGEYEFAPQLYLVGQGNMLNKSDDRSAYFGLRKTF